jgi:hypothetical protein
MRDKHLMQVVLGLNVALAVACAAYVAINNRHAPPATTSSFTKTASEISSNEPARVPLSTAVSRTNPVPAITSAAPATLASGVATNGSSGSPGSPGALALAPGFPAKLPYISRKITWQDVQSPEYRTYMENLRRAGCPEATVNRIALDDINELFAQRRLKIAEQHDPQWWRPEAYYAMAALPRTLQDSAQQFEAERKDLITQLLGAETAQSERQESVFWTDVQLTGSVLGRLSPSKHAAVQAVCRESLERHDTAADITAQPGQNANAVEVARLREQTRVALRKVLSEDEMIEFLLRYSQNAARLRDELRDFDPSADEFRRIFRVTDPLDHALQLEYGSPDALSTNQRDRWQRQRDEAIKEVLSAERYVAYRRSKDPLYRQAMLYATQYGAPPQAVQPIYEMTQTVEGRRQEIINDTTLTAQEKSQALQAVNLEQHKNIQKIVREVHEKVNPTR